MPVLTFLCDNDALPGMEKEWGLSVALELDNGSLWLWDTGQTAIFLRNAERLGIDVNRAQGLALSHGHFDHTGGLPALLENGFSGQIYAHPGTVRARWNLIAEKRSIGTPTPLPLFTAVQGRQTLAPGLEMFTDIPRKPGLFQAVEGFFYDAQGQEPDTVPDDAFLVLDSPQGKIILLGCCHSGLENSLLHFRETTGVERIHAVIGGLHLYRVEEPEWESVARCLEEFDVRFLAAGHCTGEKAIRFLAERLTCTVTRIGSGKRLEFN
ncbi:MAG: MBL fold metallo-hydrolase [Desulfovibrionaceae bacterium]